jgi:hypothetical protein
MTYFITQPMNARHEPVFQIIHNATSYACQTANSCTGHESASNTSKHW